MKKIKVISSPFLFVSLCLLNLLVVDQTLAQSDNIGHLIPKEDKLLQLSGVPVNYYNGQISISVPLFQIGDELLNHSISLNYTGQAIDFEEIPSAVGVNWTLMAGGRISKETRGLADFGNELINCGGTGQYCGNAYRLGLNGQSLSDLYSSICSGQNLPPPEGVDSEPDIFYFNFGGHSGSFMYDSVPVFEDGNELKIISHPHLGAGRWIVQDSRGYIYTFLAKQFNQQSVTVRDQLVYPFEFTSRSHSWRLTEIQAPTGQRMTFSYILARSSYESYVQKENSDSKVFRNSKQMADLKQINFYSSDNVLTQQADFTYSSVRYDAGNHGDSLYVHGNHTVNVGLHKLENVKLKKIGQQNDSTIQYDFIYYEPNSSNRQRYFLKSIEKMGYNAYGEAFRDDYQYEFEYNSHKLLPKLFVCFSTYVKIHYGTSYPPEKRYNYSYFSHQKDYWNFYNNIDPNICPDCSVSPHETHRNICMVPKSNLFGTSIQTNGVNKQTDTTRVKYGLLSKIIYPTKGYKTFDFESNTFQIDGTNYYGGGVRIKSIKTFDGKAFTSRYFDYNLQDGTSSGKLMTVPKFKYLKYNYHSSDQGLALRSYVDSKSIIPLSRSAQGAYVGYSRVTINYGTLDGQEGRQILSFHNQADELNPVQRFHGTGEENAFIHDLPTIKDVRNGQLLADSVYAYKNGAFHLKRTVANTYKRLITKRIYGFKQEYPRHLEKTKYTPIDSNRYDIIVSHRAYDGENSTNYCKYLRFSYYQNNFDRYALKESIETDYTDLGTFKNKTTYTYYDFDQVKHSRVRTIATQNSKKQWTANYYDYDVTHADGHFFIRLALQRNQKVKHGTYSPSEIVGARYSYNNKGQLMSIRQAKKVDDRSLDDLFNEKKALVQENSYYSSGKLKMQKTKQMQKELVFLWSYNGSYPIAHIAGANYNQVLQAMGGQTEIDNLATLHSPSDSELRTLFLTLRTQLPQAQVSGYIYEPLVGLKETIDPNGHSRKQHYDPLGRLYQVFDNQGNVVIEYDYNYKKN